MPAKRHWTEADDNTLREMRAANADWQAIANVWGLSRWRVVVRGKFLGIYDGVTREAKRPPEPAIELSAEIGRLTRDPLPPGHPETWGVIVAGTMLEGVEYRYAAP